MSGVSSKIFVSRDAAALALGADAVAKALTPHATVVRTGSRGLFWLEPMIEVATPTGRIAYGPVAAADVPGLLAAGVTSLHAKVTERVAPGILYTTFHHPGTQANVVTTEYSDWATNCPEYKVTAVQISPSNGPSEWQETYRELSAKSRRIEVVPAK